MPNKRFEAYAVKAFRFFLMARRPALLKRSVMRMSISFTQPDSLPPESRDKARSHISL